MFNKRKKQPTISFVSTIEGLEDIDEIRPVPYRKMLPDWWKETPLIDPESDSFTVKKCPGIMDYFLHGYVMPMWADAKVVYDKNSDRWSAKIGNGQNIPNIDAHGNDQFLKYVDVKVLNKKADFVFRTNCPWKIITKPGWSVYQMPLFYHFNGEFTTLPGIIDTDIYHETNPQIVYFGGGEEVTIKRGTPLALYVPFKREKITDDIRFMNEKDIKSLNKVSAHLGTKFDLNGFYRLMQKQRNTRGV